jgi:DNA-binding transcriptional MerR regulator
LRMNDIVKLTNCHPNTIRRATDNALLPCFRLPSGARRFRLRDVQSWLGQTDGTGEQEQEKKPSGLVPIAACIRVSSPKQGSASKKEGDDAKSSLELQEQRVAAYIRQRWGN